jgi:hypothetical protein
VGCTQKWIEGWGWATVPKPYYPPGKRPVGAIVHQGSSLLVWGKPKVAPRSAAGKPTKVFGGRTKRWLVYPRGWAAGQPRIDPPYVFKGFAERALELADRQGFPTAFSFVRGINHPDIRGFAEQAVERVRAVSETIYSPGPKIEKRTEGERRLPFISINGEVTWQSVPNNLPLERARYRVELRERKRFRDDARSRVVTNDFKGDNREPGPVVTITRDGKVRLAPYGAWTPRREDVAVRGVNDYSSERWVLDESGKRRKVEGQQSPQTNKPGRKPIGPIAMTGAERVRRHRLAKRLALTALSATPAAGKPFPQGRPAVDLLQKERKTP